MNRFISKLNAAADRLDAWVGQNVYRGLLATVIFGIIFWTLILKVALR